MKFFGGCLGIIVLVVMVMALLAVISLIPTMIWYTFDDALASALELPGLGTLRWYSVYGFSWFVSLLTGGSAIVKNTSSGS